MKYRYLLICFVLVVGGFPRYGAARSPLRQIEEIASSADMQAAWIGVSLVDLETGKERVDFHARQSGAPASLTKLFTTAVALAKLGTDYCIETRLAYEGVCNSEGVLKGNIYLIGAGDPTLGSAYLSDRNFFPEMLAALQRRGIRRIEGALIADASALGPEGVSPDWLWSDLGNYYAAGCYALNYHDNSYQITLSASENNAAPTVQAVTPWVDSLRFLNRLSFTKERQDSIYIAGAPFSFERTLNGIVRQRSGSISVKGDIPNPPLFLAQVLLGYLRENGIEITGEAQVVWTSVAGLNLSELYIHRSASLYELIKETNFRSNNLYAEALFRQIGLQEGSPATQMQSGAALKEQLIKWGIDTAPLLLCDGCGLSPRNRVTPRSITALLQAICQMPQGENFAETLPQVGKEGTVRNLLVDSPHRKNMRLKSGSFTGVRCYAGYLYQQERPRYALSVMINNYTGSTIVLKARMEAILKALGDFCDKECFFANK